MGASGCSFHPEGFCKLGNLCLPEASADEPDWELAHPAAEVGRLRLRHRPARHLLDHLVGAARHQFRAYPETVATRVARDRLRRAWDGLQAVVRNDVFPTNEANATVTWVYLVDDDRLVDLWGSPRMAVYARACSEQANQCNPGCEQPRPNATTIRTVFQQRPVFHATLHRHLVKWSSFSNDKVLAAFLARQAFDRWILASYQNVGAVDTSAPPPTPYTPPGATHSRLSLPVRLEPLDPELPELVLELSVACGRTLQPKDVAKHLREHPRVVVLRAGPRLVGRFV